MEIINVIKLFSKSSKKLHYQNQIQSLYWDCMNFNRNDFELLDSTSFVKNYISIASISGYLFLNIIKAISHDDQIYFNSFLLIYNKSYYFLDPFMMSSSELLIYFYSITCISCNFSNNSWDNGPAFNFGSIFTLYIYSS